MKNLMYVLLIGFLFTACKGPGGDKAEVTEVKEEAKASEEAKDLSVDLETSEVTWLGTKPAGKHNGIIKLESGTISVEDGAITAGEFTMDMSTVESTDEGMNEENNEKLSGHLKSADFFNVEEFPTSTFTITKVEDISARATDEALELEGATHYISGNLTMKDSTNGVSFPAIVTLSEEGVTAKAEFTIKRTAWGMSYGNDKSLGDKFIHPEVKVGFDITAN